MNFAHPLMLLVNGLLAAGGPEGAGSSDLAAHVDYGFGPLIQSKFNRSVTHLRDADLNGDGRGDLALINNLKSRIELLYWQDPEDRIARFEEEEPGPNALPEETYFRRESYPLEEKVSSFQPEDIDGDGRVDLVFAGDSRKLSVAFQKEGGEFAEAERFDLEDLGDEIPSLQCADLDRDGRQDIVVFAGPELHVFLHDESGSLKPGPRLPSPTPNPSAFRLLDADGDTIVDLLVVKTDSERPFRLRRGLGDGTFGPEQSFEFTEIRSFWAGDVEKDGRVDVVAVRRRSGRLALFRFEPSGEVQTDLLPVWALPRSESSDDRGALVADLDGDGEDDLLLTDPREARVVVFRGQPGSSFGKPHTFPSFLGVRNPRLGDLDGDGRAELIVGAPDEGAVGVSSLDGSGFPGFPRALRVPGEELLAVDYCSSADSNSGIWVVVGQGKGSKRSHQLVHLNPDGEPFHREDLGRNRADPHHLRMRDFNGDGSTDALLFFPKEMPRILVSSMGEEGLSFQDLTRDAEGEPQEVPGLGILEEVEPAAMAFVDVDGDGLEELLVPGSNFARGFRIGENGIPEVRGQYSVDQPGAKVDAASAVDWDGDGHAEIFLVDRSRRVVVIVDGASGDTRRHSLVGINPHQILVRNATTRPEIVLLGEGRFAVMRPASAALDLVAVSEFEFPFKSGYLDDVAAGDVNSDGKTDLVVTETQRHRLEICTLAEGVLEHVMKFPVFEERLFERSGRGNSKQPRTVLVADATGDGRDDIAVLVHDRLIVYPQE